MCSAAFGLARDSVPTMRIPLEDQFHDIIGKARRGLKLSESLLVQRAHIGFEELEALQAGQFNVDAASKIAEVLDLDPPSLIALGRESWYPPAPDLPATFAAFNTPFEDMTVNAYLLWDREGGSAAAFDTGGDCTRMLEAIRQHGLKVESIFLTHTHYDHVADLDDLVTETGAAVFVSNREKLPGATPIEEGAEFRVGALKITARQTSGHSPGGMTYVVEGLEGGVTLAIVGDALFAGSMGGVPPEGYAAALRMNREKILTLPAETIVCPGHGPLTTVALENGHNPFYAGR